MLVANDEFDLILTFAPDAGLVHLIIPHRAHGSGLEELRFAMAESDWTELAVRGHLCLACAREGLDAALRDPTVRIAYGRELKLVDDVFRADMRNALASVAQHHLH